MIKNELRIKFAKPEYAVSFFYSITDHTNSTLDSSINSLVTVFLDDDARAHQLRLIYSALSFVPKHQWNLVGPACPNHWKSAHAVDEISMKYWPSTRKWRCLNCKIEVPVDNYSIMNRHEFLFLEVVSTNKEKEEVSAPVLKATEKQTGLSKASDAMFRFLSGLDFQDHPIRDQREFIKLMSELKTELKKIGIGSHD